MIKRYFPLISFFVFFLFASGAVNCQEKGKFTDPRDKESYEWIRIGNQVWMKENMHFAVQGGSWSYNDFKDAGEKYGFLYDWPSALKACPRGWHLPADSEWTQLVDYLGGGDFAGGKVMDTGTASWKAPNPFGTNETGFTALPAGYRHFTGVFSEITTNAYFWSATDHSEEFAFYRCLTWKRTNLYKYSGDKRMGFSVRCVRDKR